MKKEQLFLLVNNYKERQLKAINETLGIDDAFAIAFDIPKLKELIAEIEDVTDVSDDVKIVFNYGAYPKADEWESMEGTGVPIEYAGLHTLIMTPTINGNVVEKQSNVVAFARRIEEDLIAENHGQLIPPRGGGKAIDDLN